MAQSLSVHSSNPYFRADMEPFKVTCDWQGDADVAVSLGITTEYTKARFLAGLRDPFPSRIIGRVLSFETIPGVSGDKATYIPAGTYAVQLRDAYGYDLLDGAGAARSISAAEVVAYQTPVPVDGEITLVIASTATSDQLAGDGAFASVANWTLGAGWSDGTGHVHKAAGTGTLAHAGGSAFAATAGRKYDVTYTIASWAAAANRTLTVTCGGATGTARSADGTYTDTITAATTGGLIFTPTGTDANNVAFHLDDVTVKFNSPSGRCIVYFV